VVVELQVDFYLNLLLRDVDEMFVAVLKVQHINGQLKF
jgi:hypothetical protein